MILQLVRSVEIGNGGRIFLQPGSGSVNVTTRLLTAGPNHLHRFRSDDVIRLIAHCNYITIIIIVIAVVI